MQRILITGASGLLGSTLAPFLSQSGFDVVCHSRDGGGVFEAADLSDLGQTKQLFERVKPNVIINLAAATSVDACEKNPQAAYIGNVRVIENIAAAIQKQPTNCYLIHISTDHVYDSEGPHTEDQVRLCNYYAFSKYAGEMAAAVVPSTVLRTNFFGRSQAPHRTSFSDWLVGALRNQETIQVFDDVAFSPLCMSTISKLIPTVIKAKHTGTFNLGCHEGSTKADFAFALAQAFKLPATGLQRAKISEAKLGTYRPKDMRMDSSKFEQTFNIKLPTLNQEIESLKEQYDDKQES